MTGPERAVAFLGGAILWDSLAGRYFEATARVYPDVHLRLSVLSAICAGIFTVSILELAQLLGRRRLAKRIAARILDLVMGKANRDGWPGEKTGPEEGIPLPDPGSFFPPAPGYVTILAVAVARGAGEIDPHADPRGVQIGYLKEADFRRVGLAMVGGCETCGETIGPGNAYPSRSGFWRCAECIGTLGFRTVDEFELHTRGYRGGGAV